MRILWARIHNFRSIRNAKIAFGPYTVVVGANNSGKSNIVEALLTFFGRRSPDPKRDVPRWKSLTTPVTESWVEAEFELTEEEYTTLSASYQIGQNRLRVRNVLPISDGSKAKASAYELVDGKVVLSSNQFYGWTDTAKLGNIVVIPALSRVDDHMKMTNTTAFGQMMTPFVKELFADDGETELRKAAEAMATSVATMGAHFRKTAIDIESAINSDLGGWGLTFSVGTNAPDAQKLLTDCISHAISDPCVADSQPVGSFGQGFQRHLIYVLLKLRATRPVKPGKVAKAEEPAKPTKVKKSAKAEGEDDAKKVFCPSFFLLLFEEPEAFLHPSQLDTLHRTLLKLSGPAAQVLVTTHSPQMASNRIGDLTSFVRVVRTDGVSRMHQIEQVRLNQILKSNTAEVVSWSADTTFKKKVNPDDLLVQMDAIKYALWLNPLRTKAFFADRVLLVEGPTEVALLGWMSDERLLGPEMDGVVVVDAMGKFNIHRFMNLFEGLGIRHAVLMDQDGGAYATTVDATIAGARNPLTLHIHGFPDDLERYLGLPKVLDPHRKPQSLMFNLAQSQVPEANLSALATLVGGLMTVPANP